MIFKNVTVLNMDGVKDDYGWSCRPYQVTFPAIVPVVYRYDSKFPIGEANLYTVGKELHADISVGVAVADLINKGAKLVPCVGGRVLEQTRTGDKDKIELYEIGLSNKNVDSRIKPLEKVK